MTIQFPTSPNVCFCTTWGKHNQRNITFNAMRYDCLINITCKNKFCSHFWHCGWQFIQLSSRRGRWFSQARRQLTKERNCGLQQQQHNGETATHVTAASPLQLCQLQSVPVGIQSWSLDKVCASKSSRQHLHCSRWQTDLCADLSAAYDTVNHSLLIKHLHSEFRVTDTSLEWLRSYLVNRAQFVKMGHQSDTVPLNLGVPQGSMLGPLLYAIYCSPVSDVISQHGVKYDQYADDT